MKRAMLIALAILFVSTFALGCSQATDSEKPGKAATTDTKSTSNPNQIIATVVGDVIDGSNQRPIDGATIVYSDGESPGAASRTISAPVSVRGKYEILFRNPGYDAMTGDGISGLEMYAYYTIFVSKANYTTRTVIVKVPTIKAIRTWIGSLEKPVEPGFTKEIEIIDNTTASEAGGTAATATVTYVAEPDVFTGWHVTLNLPMPAVLYQTNATLTGRLLLKKNDMDNDPATVPLALADISFDMYDPMYSGAPVFTVAGKTTADGSFSLANVPAVHIIESESFYGDLFGLRVLVPRSETVSTRGSSDANDVWKMVVVTDAALSPNASFSIDTKVVDEELPPAVTGWLPYSDTDARLDPGTSAARTSVSIQFNKPMDTSRSTIMRIWEDDVDKTDLYSPALTWDTTPTNLDMKVTVAPAIPFRKGTTIKLQPVAFFDTEGAMYASPDSPPTDFLKFYIKNGIYFVRASSQDVYGVDQPVAASASASLIFNTAPASFDQFATKLYEITGSGTLTITEKPAAFTVDAATKALVVDPSVNLKPDTRYGVAYRVYSGVVGEEACELFDNTATGTVFEGFTFTTAKAVAPTLVSTNAWKYGYVSQDAFPIASNLTLGFDVAVAATPAYKVELYEDEADTPSTFTDDVLCEIAVTPSTDMKTLNVNPLVDFDYDRGYYVLYEVWGGTEAETQTSTIGAAATKAIWFTTLKPASPRLVSSNAFTATWRPRADFGVDEEIALGFDSAVYQSAPWAYEITLEDSDTSDIIACAIGYDTVAREFTLTPNGDLDYGTGYTVSYSVYTGFYGEAASTGTLDFSTEYLSLATPVLAIDPIYQVLPTTTYSTGFNANTGYTVRFLVSKAADAADSYTFQYRYKNSLTMAWAGAATVPVSGSTTVRDAATANPKYVLDCNFTTAGAAIPDNAADALQVRAIAKKTYGSDTIASTPSNVLEYADTVAPSRALFSVYDNINATTNTVNATGAQTINIGAGPGTGANRYMILRFIFTPVGGGVGDQIATITPTVSTTLSSMTLNASYDYGSTGTISLYITVADNPTYAGAITFTARDAHGNSVDWNPTTAGTQTDFIVSIAQ